MKTQLETPIMLVYDFLYNEPFGTERNAIIIKTKEEWDRIVKILHENKDKYKVILVRKGIHPLTNK